MGVSVHVRAGHRTYPVGQLAGSAALLSAGSAPRHDRMLASATGRATAHDGSAGDARHGAATAGGVVLAARSHDRNRKSLRQRIPGTAGPLAAGACRDVTMTSLRAASDNVVRVAVIVVVVVQPADGN